jgi:hypothetical protein
MAATTLYDMQRGVSALNSIPASRSAVKNYDDVAIARAASEASALQDARERSIRQTETDYDLGLRRSNFREAKRSGTIGVGLGLGSLGIEGFRAYINNQSDIEEQARSAFELEQYRAEMRAIRDDLEKYGVALGLQKPLDTAPITTYQGTWDLSRQTPAIRENM